MKNHVESFAELRGAESSLVWAIPIERQCGEGSRVNRDCLRWQMRTSLFTVVNMPRRTGTSARTLALTKAQEAVALRDAERITREKRLEATLADYFQAQGEVERIHRDAEALAAPFEASIREAVRALDRLGETRAGIAGLTGLSLTRVRDYLFEMGANGQARDASMIRGPAGSGSWQDPGASGKPISNAGG